MTSEESPTVSQSRIKTECCVPNATVITFLTSLFPEIAGDLELQDVVGGNIQVRPVGAASGSDVPGIFSRAKAISRALSSRPAAA